MSNEPVKLRPLLLEYQHLVIHQSVPEIQHPSYFNIKVPITSVGFTPACPKTLHVPMMTGFCSGLLICGLPFAMLLGLKRAVEPQHELVDDATKSLSTAEIKLPRVPRQHTQASGFVSARSSPEKSPLSEKQRRSSGRRGSRFRRTSSANSTETVINDPSLLGKEIERLQRALESEQQHVLRCHQVVIS